MFYIKWGTNQCEVSWLWGLVYYNGCQLCDIIVWFIIPMGTNVWYHGNCVVSWLWGIMELSGVIFSTGATGSMNIDGQTNMKPPIGFRTISQKCSNYCSGVIQVGWNLTNETTWPKGRIPLPNWMNFWKSSQPLPPPPHFWKIILQFFIMDIVAFMQGGIGQIVSVNIS